MSGLKYRDWKTMNSLNHEVFCQYQAKHFSLQYHLKHYHAATSHTHKPNSVNKACLQVLPLWANKQPLVNLPISPDFSRPYHPDHRPKSATMSTQTFPSPFLSLPTELSSQSGDLQLKLSRKEPATTSSPSRAPSSQLPMTTASSFLPATASYGHADYLVRPL